MNGGRYGPDQLFIESWQQVRQRVHSVAMHKGWWDKPKSFPELLVLLHSEVSEALEYYRNGEANSDHIPEFSGVEEELADVVIRIMDMAEHCGFRVAQAVLAKTKFNATRPYRHGGKKL